MKDSVNDLARQDFYLRKERDLGLFHDYKRQLKDAEMARAIVKHNYKQLRDRDRLPS